MKKLLAIGLALASAIAVPVSAETNKTDQATVTAVQRHIDAYRSGSMDRFMSTFAPDAIMSINGNEVKGRERIRSYYALNFDPNFAHTLRVVDSTIVEGWVILTTAFTFEGAGEKCCFESQYQVKNGKIAFVAMSM